MYAEKSRFVCFLCRLLIIFYVCAVVRADEQECQYRVHGKNTAFPQNFSFGVSTAAYQIEGGWNADGKGPSVWDTFVHNHPDMIKDLSNGDVGPDSYHKFELDLAALKELKVQHYRFSISWSRLFPTGDIVTKSLNGFAYYDKVIDALIANNIEPVVTMFHYDLPDDLMKFGGFTNEVIVRYFRYYADALFAHYGNRVKTWITFNEPFDYCIPGYGDTTYPPQANSPGVGDYMCMETTLKAHAAAYRLYRSKFYRDQGGKVGITLSTRYYYPKRSDDTSDLLDRCMQYSLGWLGHPIYSVAGNYPYVMLEDIISNSMMEGRGWSRLNPLKEFWLEMIKGSADFLGLNYYTSRYVENAEVPLQGPSWAADLNVQYDIDPKWRRAKSSWLYCVPQGLEELLNWIREHYNNVEVIITENGWSDDGQLNDTERIDYLKAHLQAVLNAINNGCNVTAYTHWSLIDNFEWDLGYTEKFGLYYVNMTSENKERIAKDSSRYYRKVIETRSIPNA